MLSLLWALFQTHYFEIWLSLFSYIANISESFNGEKVSTTVFEGSVKIHQRSYSVSVERVSSQLRKPDHKDLPEREHQKTENTNHQTHTVAKLCGSRCRITKLIN